MKKALALLVITAALALAQVPKPGGGGGPGGSGATSLDGLSDVAVGSSPPGTCTDNHYYVDTSESVPADMLKVCRSNTWYKVSELTGSNCIDVVGRDISLCSSVPLWSSGASDPSGANTAGEWYLQTTTKDLWMGEGGTTWRRVTPSVFALVDTGGDDTYGNSTACAGFPATYVDGQVVILQATTANTGAATLDCRPGAKAIKLPDGTTDPTTGDVVAFKPTILQYKSSADGGSGAWILLVPGSSSSSGGGALFTFFESTGLPQNATRYASIGVTQGNATESTRQIPYGRTGTVKTLYVRLASNVGGSSDTVVATVRKNGADTALTCTISTGASTCSDTTSGHAVTVSDGADLFTVKLVASAATGTYFPYITVSFE